MSYLYFPRIHFQGTFSASPCTANDDDVMYAVNSVNLSLAEPLAMLSRDPATADMARKWLRAPVYMQGNRGADHLPRMTVFLSSGWNYYGDYGTRFEGTVVSGCVGADGAPVPGDSLLGEPVYLLGSPMPGNPTRPPGPAMMIDVDCTGLITTQLWIGGFQIGNDTLRLKSVHDTRAYQRRLSFQRTLGVYGGEQNFVNFGAYFQFSIPTSELCFSGDETSPTLAALRAALTSSRDPSLPSPRGICVRFMIFQAQPDISGDDLWKRFQQGQYDPNPVYAYLLGSIGVWYEGELATTTQGRYLAPATPYPEVAWKDRDGEVQTTPLTAGSATAVMHPDRPLISVDLVNTLSNDRYRYPEKIENFKPLKADIGKLQLAYIPEGKSRAVPIATVPYGTTFESYRQHRDLGEISDFTFDPAERDAIRRGTLVLQIPSHGAVTGANEAPIVILAEQRTRVSTDARGVYLDSGQETTISVVVTDRGGPPAEDLTIYLAEYHDIIVPRGSGQRPDQTIGPGVPPRLDFSDLEKLDFPDPGEHERGWTLFKLRVPAGTSQAIQLRVRAIAAGPATIAFSDSIATFKTLEGLGQPWGAAAYANFRVFSEKSYEHLFVGEPIPFNFVYREILQYYYVLYPAMSLYIPLNQEEALIEAAPSILERIDLKNFHSTHFMPPTRCMSPGKRALLQRWLKQHLGRDA